MEGFALLLGYFVIVMVILFAAAGAIGFLVAVQQDLAQPHHRLVSRWSARFGTLFGIAFGWSVVGGIIWLLVATR